MIVRASSRAPNESHESEFDDKRAIRARGHWLRARVFPPSQITQEVRASEGGREGVSEGERNGREGRLLSDLEEELNV